MAECKSYKHSPVSRFTASSAAWEEIKAKLQAAREGSDGDSDTETPEERQERIAKVAAWEKQKRSEAAKVKLR